MSSLHTRIKDNMFNKLKNFIKGLLKKDVIAEIAQPQNHISGEKEESSSYINNLSKETKKYMKRYEIIEQIDENPEIIYTLPLERLKQLTQLYNERTAEIEQENNNLDFKINALKKEYFA